MLGYIDGDKETLRKKKLGAVVGCGARRQWSLDLATAFWWGGCRQTPTGGTRFD